jgi:orotate phosphoribosyltransferase
MQADSIPQGANVIVVDDLIATGMSDPFTLFGTDDMQEDPQKLLVISSRRSVQRRSNISLSSVCHS